MARHASAFPVAKVSLDARHRRIHIRAPAAFSGEVGQSVCENFLRRVFTVRSIRSVDLDRVNGDVMISHAVGAEGLPELLQLLSSALVEERSGLPCRVSAPLIGRRLVLYRYGESVTASQVLQDDIGLLELRRPDLTHNPSARRRVVLFLTSLRGVKAVRSRRSSRRLTISYDPLSIDAAQLLQRVDEVFHRESWVTLQTVAKTPYGMAPAAVSVSAGALLIPELAVFSALLLVGMNVKTVGTALCDLRDRRWGLPVLYSTILLTTLATGQFFPAALMTWFFRFWRRRFEQKLARVQFDLLEGYLPKPVYARVRTEKGSRQAVETDALRVGDLIMIRPGDIVPADALILEGHCAVTFHRAAHVEPVPRQKGPGDRIHAGSWVVFGEITASVEKTGANTRAANLGRMLIDAMTPTPGAMAPTESGERFARQAVKPTLFLAGVGGLATGDLLTAGGVLRPDYATGVGLSESMTHWAGLDRCLSTGVVLRSPHALETLLSIKVILIDQRIKAKTDWRVEFSERAGSRPGVLASLVAGVLHHAGDERAAAARRACRHDGFQPLPLNILKFGKRGYTAQFRGHRIDLIETVDRVRGGVRLTLKVDGASAGTATFSRQPSTQFFETQEALRTLNPALTLICLEDQGNRESLALVERGIDPHMEQLLDPNESLSDRIRHYQQGAGPVALIGDLTSQESTGLSPDLRIHLGESPTHDADIHLLDADLAALPDLWRIAMAQAEALRQTIHGALAPNLLCVAGCFLLDFTSIHAVALSNLGTLALYSKAKTPLASPDVGMGETPERP